MLTLPAKVRRKKQPYLAIRSQLLRRHLQRQATVFFTELRQHMNGRGIDDAGPGFLRYVRVGQDGEHEMEFGYFTDRVHAGSGPIRSGILPAGTFMSSEWVGPYDKLAEVNAMWPAWVQYTGADLDINETDAGIDYACRLKIFHVSPRHTQNPAEFRTEIAIMMRSGVEAGVSERMHHPGAGKAPSFEHFPSGN